ncbi:MAG TPA: SIR2 family protein [Pyrinomonadaceae bacterium]|nr:SIR2 family protein [Pyrinomonadaceae bacterium]
MPEPRFIELDEAVSRIKQAYEGHSPSAASPYFFMVGAGISYPSVPLAAQIISQCKEVARGYGRGEDPKKRTSLEDYSYWFEAAYAHRDQRQNYLRKLILEKPITHANFRLAHLLLNNTISNLVVTTNFDDFLSKALTLFGKPHIICDHPRTVSRINPDPNPEECIPQIIHLHGSYSFYDLINVRGELEDRAQQSRQTASTMASLLDRIMWDRSPLVIGYSGWEGDVFMEALRRGIDRGLRRNAYWFCYRKNVVDSLPEQVRNSSDIWFVVPSDKSSSKTTAESISVNLEAGQETKAKPLSGESNDGPSLSAEAVMDKLIQAFQPELPELTRNPLAFFVRSLETSLPYEDATQLGTDLYTIKNVIERVRRAKQREEEEIAAATITPSESKLENIREALRRADYDEAIHQGMQIQLGTLSTKDLEELADAMWSAATGLYDNSPEEISAYDVVVNIRDELVERQVIETPAMQVRVANALVNKGITLGSLNRSEEAISVYDDVLQRFGDAAEPALRAQLANALVGKGFRLGTLNRSEEEITVYDEVLQRFGEATEPALRAHVAKALVNKGITLSSLNRHEEEITVYDEVLQRFGDATEPVLRARVATALVNKGVALGSLNRHEEAIMVYGEVLQRFGETTEPALQEQIAKSLVNKGVSLSSLNRSEEEIAVYDQVLQRYGEATDEYLEKQVARASVYKGITLSSLNRNEEAIAMYEEVLQRYGNATEPGIQEYVRKALINKEAAERDRHQK